MNDKILQTLSYGMYALGVKGINGPSASIVNTVFQVTNSPAIVAVSVNHQNYSNDCIKDTGMFTVSVLSEDTPGTVIGALGYNSGRTLDKLANIKSKILKEGLPVLKENSCCWFLCKVVDTIETSSHTVFIGEIIAGSENFSGTPMTYRYYHEVIKGSAPKTAPTYQRTVPDSTPVDDYVCTICGYVYNDTEVDFDSLPDNWVCPVCGAPKSVFKLK